MTNLKKQAPPTRLLEETIVKDIHDDAFPPSESQNLKTNHVTYKILEVEMANKAYTDLTERFPYQSSRGNQYILIGYHYAGNTILAEPLKNRMSPLITAA